MNIVLKTKLHLRFCLALLLLLEGFYLHAQDIHFSQFYNAPPLLNPALTGVSKGDMRFSGIFRSQWSSANSPYKTIWISGENRFYNVTHENWWLSGGLNLFYDKAGDSNLATTSVLFSGSYTKMLNKFNFLTLGLSGGFGQRKFEMQDLTFDNQWNGDIFDPNRTINENFNDPGLAYPDFGVGINWRGQSGVKRTKMDLGAGAFHFNRPNQSFQSNDKSQLPVRVSMYIMPTVQVSPKVDVVGYGTAQTQGSDFEALAGAAGRLHLSEQKSKEIAVQLGFTYRFNAIGDALIPAAELHFHQWVVGLSWDVNVSNFSTATNRNGGPEIAIQYLFKKVYPLKAFKACPLL